MEKEITIEIKHAESMLLLLLLFIFLFLELQVTFNTPINFGDEGFHTRMAQYIAENKEYPIFTILEETKLNYGGFVRPPLFNLLEANFFLIFENDLPIRFLTPFIAILTGIVTFILVKKLYNEKIGFIAAILTVTIPSFVIYSVTFYTDMLCVFYVTIFFLLFLLATKENSKKYLILSGIFGGLAFLTDLSGLSVYIFAFIVIFYEILTTKTFFNQIKKYAIFISILILIGLPFIGRNLFYFNNPLCRSDFPILNKIWNTEKCSVNKIQSKYQFAGRVEQVGTEQNVYSLGIMNYLDFSYGNLLLVIFGFFAGLILLLTKRNKIVDFLIIYFVIFLFLFYISTGRAEDTARNTLEWVPMFALVSAQFFGEVYDFLKKYHKYIAIAFIIVIILISYQMFKEKLDTMFSVKQFSPLFFEACNWIKSNTPKNSSLYTVWAHRAIYNCQRNAVGLGTIPDIALSRDVNYTVEVAKENGITHIFIQKFSIDPANQHLYEKYDLEFVQFLESNPNHFKKVYENGPSLTECQQYWQRGYQCDGNIIYEIKF